MIRILCLMTFALLLTACSDAVYWYDRTVFQRDCRQDKLTNGQCTSTKKGAQNAAQAQP